MKVVVDWALCDGNGVCSVEAPDIFELNDDDELVVLKDEFGAELKEQASAAVRVCPKRALRLEA
ncbi:ferredoxin [Novosphingopyxis sp.]|uniref:ferredoxin n=1 Tax=Novosphingopyxis sp. TaxID=2709690 RepID=UPI003B5AC106